MATKAAGIQTMALEDVLHNSILPYAEYVIMERALPRVEDGLKPVQRRILYTMLELGLFPDKPHRKSARIVGDALGKYHPHGDTSVYDAMVRMAQDYNMRAPLVDGHGNFGSVDGDPAAAMRYTEARMTPLAMQLLRDLDKDTVPFQLNFDDTQKEPVLLPGRFPNLLVNGATGIAVGLATNIAPHNLGEAIEAVVYRMEHPDCSLDAVMEILPAPDFPTGGLLIKNDAIRQAYESGRAKLSLRARTEIEFERNGKSRIVITQLPYQVNKVTMLERIAKVAEEKKDIFQGITDIRDESDREGIRAVVELRRGVDPYSVQEYLYKYTDMQVTVGVNIVAIADGKPRTLGLLELIDYYIRHQKNVVTARTRYDLEAAQRRAHILSAFMKVLDDLDLAISIIRAAQTVDAARSGLMEAFDLDREQAQAVLDLRLQRLTGMEMLKIAQEFEQIQKKIKGYQSILNSATRLRNLIIKELREVSAQHGDARRTQLIDAPKMPAKLEKPKPVAEEVVIVYTRGGYLKRLSAKATQKGLDVGENGQTIQNIICATTLDKLHAFTSTGQMVQLPVSAIPETKGNGRGTLLYGLLPGMEEGEQVVALERLPRDAQVVFCTKNGMIKRSNAADYFIRKMRAPAITLKGEDTLCAAIVLHALQPSPDLLLVSAGGMAIRFAADAVAVTGRTTAGVRAMALEATDALLFAQAITPQREQLLVVSDGGYAKRLRLAELDAQKRGGKGVRIMDLGARNKAGSALLYALCPGAATELELVDAGLSISRMQADEVPQGKRGGSGLTRISPQRLERAYALIPPEWEALRKQ